VGRDDIPTGLGESVSCMDTRRAYTPPCATKVSCVPCSTTLPSSKTMIVSASFTVDRRCAIRSEVRPAINRCSASCTSQAENLCRYPTASPVTAGQIPSTSLKPSAEPDPKAETDAGNVVVLAPQIEFARCEQGVMVRCLPQRQIPFALHVADQGNGASFTINGRL